MTTPTPPLRGNNPNNGRDMSFNNGYVNVTYAVAVIALLAAMFFVFGRTFDATGVNNAIDVELDDGSTENVSLCSADYSVVKAQYDEAVAAGENLETCVRKALPFQAAPNAIYWAVGILAVALGAVLLLERMNWPNRAQIIGAMLIAVVGFGLVYINKMENEPEVWTQVFFRGLVAIGILGIGFVVAHVAADSFNRNSD